VAPVLVRLRPIVIDPTKILSRRELAAVLANLTERAPRSPNTWMNLILVRLACCCVGCEMRLAALSTSRALAPLAEISLRVRLPPPPRAQPGR
jgi:hypothetical protein